MPSARSATSVKYPINWLPKPVLHCPRSNKLAHSPPPNIVLIVAYAPFHFIRQMNLVAVHHRLAILPRRHERGESANLVPAPDQYVPQIRGPHLLLFGRRVPSLQRQAIVPAARLVHDAKAPVDLGLCQPRRLKEGYGISGFGHGVRPFTRSGRQRRKKRKS